MKPVVCLSGGFDPVTHGHVRLIREAAEYGDVVVILNSDDWLMRKKGFIFQDYGWRKEILEQMKGVLRVEPVDDSDGTVCEALRRIRPQFFANGGDRLPENTPELNLCTDLRIMPLFGVGGEKISGSQQLVGRALEQIRETESGMV